LFDFFGTLGCESFAGSASSASLSLASCHGGVVLLLLLLLPCVVVMLWCLVFGGLGTGTVQLLGTDTLYIHKTCKNKGPLLDIGE
jgi:hypothetical protein